MLLFRQAGDQPIAYLCGQEPFCRMVGYSYWNITKHQSNSNRRAVFVLLHTFPWKVGNTAALAVAKKNIEEFYPVVGVLERLGQHLVITITAVLKILHSQTRPWPCWSTHCQFSLVGWPTSTTTSSKVTDKDRGKGQRQKQTKTVLRGDQLPLKPAPRWHRCWNSGDDFDELFDMYFNRNKLGRCSRWVFVICIS